MSLTIMGHVWESTLGASRKLVALSYANSAQDEEFTAWASIGYLERRTSLDRKTIIAAVGWLEEAGILIDTGYRKGATKQIKLYFVSVPKLVLLRDPKNDEKEYQNSSRRGPFFRDNSPKNGTQRRKGDVIETNGDLKSLAPREKRAGPAPDKVNGIDYDWTGFAFTGLEESDRLQWQAIYPAISVPDQIDRAAYWLRTNPTKRKSNYRRFLNSWLSKAQDKGR